MSFLEATTPNLFFTGKGGVGKTSCSCATAVRLADQGRKVLLVSTDPASNIDEVFGCEIGLTPTEIPAVPGLFGLNVDPEAAAAAYREKVVGPYRGVLPEAAIASMEEQLAGACTVEIAAFNEFAKLIGTPEALASYDHVIFDTAPTGHTLRLLSLPTAWTGFIENATAGTSCLGPLQGLVEQRELYAAAVAALAAPESTTLVLVSRPEVSALDEAAVTSAELAELEINNQQLVINGDYQATDRTDPIALALETRGQSALGDMPSALQGFERITVPLKPQQLLGIDRLRTFFDPAVSDVVEAIEGSVPSLPGLGGLIDELDVAGQGLVMTMGKGGVGKTTLAIDIAVSLAEKGHDVLLSTTDPAGHVVKAAGTTPSNLTVERIDPEAEVARYRDEVMRTTGANLDDDGRALLEEDLSSPCTEEIAVFQAFAATVDKAVDRIVVLDTAPTGHTILLLDAAQSFHKEVSRQARSVPDAVLRLLPRLRDPSFTRIILCTLPEATPVHEAAALQTDLRRAEIEPFAWVVNQSLLPLELRDPVLVSRQAQEVRYVREVVETHARRAVLVPWQADEAQAQMQAEAARIPA
ncbi:MAG: arsenical pump-driving ATPase [Hyphomicrobiales bacterium]|nr:arsenical pump-driving ATPase [Hyphomicrobiales bacterium]